MAQDDTEAGQQQYVIRGGIEGRERLRLLSEVMGEGSRRLLSEVGIPPGASCLDVGCGGGDMSFELARRVGSEGRVLGVDLDAFKIDMARQEVAAQELANVFFENHDVTEWWTEETFDVVYARFLLTHLQAPGALLEALGASLRPGGVLVVEDIDFRGHFAEPPCRSLTRSVELYSSCVRRRSGDPEIGPRLPSLLRGAGFQDIELRMHHPVSLVGGIKLLICVTLESIANTVMADGLASLEELTETIDDLYQFARDPTTVMGGPRVFQAWGRVP